MTKSSGVLYIKKRPFPEVLALFIAIMPFFLSFLMDFLGLPGVVKYLIDVAWILSLMLIVAKRPLSVDRKLLPFLIFFSVFIIYTLLGYIFNFQSALYYLWGFRNNFRFYFAFIIFAMVFTEEDIKIFFKLLDILFWINAVVTLVQFFFLGYEQDFLGGIFGVDLGCNAYTTIFFSVVIAKSFILFMSREEKAWICFLKCATVLVLSALSELKFFFVIFVILLVVTSFITTFSWRKFALLLFSGIVFSFAGSIITALFGEGSSLSLEQIIKVATSENYSTADDLGRFTAISTLSNTILKSIPQKLFGLGLGNCDYSSFDMFISPFYVQYEKLNYVWMSSAFLFLEVGFVGLALFLSFFIMSFVTSHRLLRTNKSDPLCCRLAMVISLVCIIMTFYNASLRTEVGYIAYFILALPLISFKEYTVAPIEPQV